MADKFKDKSNDHQDTVAVTLPGGMATEFGWIRIFLIILPT